MPPYGLYSLANTPEELSSEGYETVTEIMEDSLLDPITYRYQPAPYTGQIPFQTMYDSYIDSPSKDLSVNYLPKGTYTGNIPSQVTGIMQQAQPFEFLSSAYEDESDEQDEEYLNQVNQSNNKLGGIIDLLAGIAIPGYGILKNVAQGGFEGLRGLNQRIQQSDFGQSRTGAEYMMRRRERKQAERAQEAMPDVYRSAREEGFTNDRGGFSTSRADRAGTSLGSGQFSSKRSTGRQGY
tara:strand:+ start:86 stop:799 length:714 start_codon:yes stop_codon:yes gene_type:complete